MKSTLTLFCAFVVLTGAAFVQPAQAEPEQDGLMPPIPAQQAQEVSLSPLEGETHPVLNLMPDKSELVRLDRDAASVVVGNPAHITVLLDTPRLAVIVPKASGATYVTILDKDGDVIMQRHVVVAAPKKNYIRIRRSCNSAQSGGRSAASSACKPESVYFCPDMCHEISGSDAGQSNRR